MIDSIQVGPIRYALRENPRFAADHMVGEIRYYEDTIDIQPGLPPARLAVALWHEVFHAILLQGGFREHDERLLDVLAHGTVDVLRDNPVLRGNGAPE